MSKPRVRFAPSPTGYLHIGSLRTALYDYLFAKKTGGELILKIEDTDQKRYVEGSVENLIDILDFLGLERNEGVFRQVAVVDDNMPVNNSKSYPGVLEAGEYGPYIQSEKLETYKKYAEELVEKGHAYYCFCEPERLEDVRKKQQVDKEAPRYDRYCLRNVSKEEVNKKLKENCSYVIRLKIPEGERIVFDDIVRGKVVFDSENIDDQVLLKSDGFPTYHLANVVDDHEMKITHVIRGEEWLSSTPKHLLLYKYFGWEPPAFAHLPLLLNPDKTKLSKRQGDVAVEDYIQKGYLKEAILNFVAFLGWNPGEGSTREIFDLEELVEKFDLSRVHKAGAVFDLKKLNWINSQWIKKISPEDLLSRTRPFLEKKDFFQKTSAEKKTEEFLKKFMMVERERLAVLSEVGESNRFFFSAPSDIRSDKELLRWKEMPDGEIKASLEKSRDILERLPELDWTRDKVEKILMETAEASFRTKDGKIDRGALLWPLRTALTGEKKSPSPFEVAWVLGKKETLARIEKALGIF